MSKTKRVIKPIIMKSFRLMDFNIFDHVIDGGADSGSGSGSGSDQEPAGRFKSKPKMEDQHFTIQMFGVNEKGETFCVYIQDFEPFFYLKVGDSWTNYNMNAFIRELKSKLDKRFHDSISSYELVDQHKLYGFSGGRKYKFIKISFKNVSALNKVKGLWFSYVPNPYSPTENIRKRENIVFQGIPVELYESGIPPILRYFHINNISPSGWVSFRTNCAIRAAIPTTTCKYEFIVPLKHLLPMPEKETRVPYKICSFDIEASSSHGDFPIPIKSYKRLASNLVDAIVKQSQFLDEAKCKNLIQQVILTAFGYARFEDIDVVYPKIMPTKELLKTRIRILLDESLDKARKANNCEDNSYMLTIDSLFEKMKETIDAGSGDGDGGDSDDEGNGHGNDLPEPTNNYKKSNTIRLPKVERTMSIVDVLLNKKYTYDEKIQITNDVLTRLFPQLEGDKVTFIGSTFMRYGETEPYLNHCIVLGSCDPVPGATIESVETEQDLLLKWTEIIQTENPDIIIGYNIFGFDYEFMFRRALENHVEREFLLLSRKTGEICGNISRDDPNTISIEHATLAIASGEYDLRFFKMTGRLQIDMYSYFRRDFNLSSYKLDVVACQFISDDISKIVCTERTGHGIVTELWSQNLTGLHVGDFIHIEITGFTADYYKNGHKFPVLDIDYGREVVEMVKGKERSNKYNIIIIGGHENIESSKSIKWGTAKDDVSPQDIFRLANGDSKDRAIVAKYCIQDCNLVHHLMNKIDVITGYVEMARICSVPISFLVFRGQGIKLTSFVAKQCREKNTLMPDLDKGGDADGYEGAIVLPPKCSMYIDNPVACVDYSSLYPSAMISQNFSHDSKVWTKEYNLAGELTRVIGERDSQGNFVYDNLPGYHYIDMEFDILAYKRKNPTSAAIKTKVGKKVCRWAQFPDNKKGILPSILEELLRARKDTRNMIKTEKDPFMQNILDKRQLGYKVTANSLYGQCGSRTSTFYEKDIAASTTATGRMMITYAKRMIEEVYGDRVYETALHGPIRTKAEYIYGDSVASYTPVYVRVNGDKFDICTIDELANKYSNGIWTTERGKDFCELVGVESWTENGWTQLERVIRHALAPHKKMMRILTHTGLVDVTDDHSLIRINGEEVSPKDVSIGTELLHCIVETDLDINVNINGECEYISNDWIYLSKLAFKAQKSGFYIKLSIVDNDLFCLEIKSNCCNNNKIQQLHEIPYEGYVYDLTTSNHHFAAGIGNMIVHNTDSVFFTFNLEHPETGEKICGKPALEMTIEIAQDAAELCSKWLKSPMELSYEKTLMPFILLSKKRYVGMLYETDPNKGKLKYMGLSLKRRDSCDYLKDVYGEILNILMDTSGKSNIGQAINFLDRSLNDLAEGRVSMDKLTITKALRSFYKKPQQIGHKVLADRIAKRDPGNKPKSGDRMRFLFINNKNAKALMGEKIETPEFIIENGLQINYTHYITNQLMKPLQQLFGLALEQIWELQNKGKAIKEYRRELANIESDDLEKYMKDKEKLCSSKVKILLFDKVLNKIHNEKNGIQTITSFFAR